MPIDTWNMEWLNQNAHRNYPISEEATMMDSTGTFKLPEDFIVDMVWPVHSTASMDDTKFHILNVSIFGEGVTLSVGYDGSPIGSVSIPSVTFVTNSSFFVYGADDFYDTLGKVVIGNLSTIMQQSAGSWTFNLAGARLEPSVIRPDLRGISSFVLVNGTDRTDPIQGDIELQAGTNMRITLIDVPGGNSQIRFDAIEGEGLTEDCTCTDDDPDAPCIRTINGVAPDSSGNFTLQGTECLEIEEITNGLGIIDECSDPCCGCDELEVVTTTLETVLTEINSLNNLASRLEAQVNAMETNLMASITGALPCTE